MRNTRAVQIQFLLSLMAISLYSYIITDSDINFFDGYPLKIITECYPNNHSKFCDDARLDLCGDKNAKDQLCLGNKYWLQVTKQGILLAIFMSTMRAIPSLVRHLMGTRRLRPATFFEIIWYGMMALTVFFTGVIDLFYYLLRGMTVPLTLPWLDGVGIFQWTREFTGDPNVVNNTDLYLTFGLGVGGIIVLFFFAMLIYRTTGLKKDIA